MMDKFCDDEGQHFTTRIDILNNKEERIHNCVSTLKLSPSDKRFIIRTICSSMDKIINTKQETKQELFYKIMMMEKILRKQMDLHNNNKKTGILSISDDLAAAADNAADIASNAAAISSM